MQGRDIASGPQEQGGDIANGRARASGIGGDDNHGTEYQAAGALGHEFACYGHHHYHGGKVAQKYRHQEGDGTERP